MVKIKLKFDIDSTIDEELLSKFIDRKDEKGLDFSKYIKLAHPNLKSTEISRYVIEYHRRNLKGILKSRSKIEQNWRKYEDYFFSETSHLFNYDWQKGNYTAYISICPINHRFDYTNKFTVYYRTIFNPNKIIVHELLHIIFNQYVDDIFPNQLTESKKGHLSEILNIILMEQPSISQIFSPDKETPYPAHEEHIPRFKKLYKKHKNMHDFLKAAIKEINSIKALK